MQDAFALRGSGTVASAARPVGAFDAVVLRGEGQAIITEGATDAVSVEWDDNLLPHVRTKVSGGRLTLSTDEDRFRQLKPTALLRYRVTVRNLARIDLHDGAGAQLDRLQSDDLMLDLHGDSRLALARLDGRTPRVSLGDNAAATISGNATYHAAGVTAQAATVNVCDNGRAEIAAQQTLDGRVAGNGAVRYAGTPRVSIQQRDNGSARSLAP